MKKMVIFKRFMALFMVLTLGALSACGGKTEVEPDITDLELVEQAITAFDLDFSLNDITEDITLPITGINGTTVDWSSSNASVITNSGTVTPSVDGNATVIMTVTLTLNDDQLTKTFTLVVLKSDSGICDNVDDPSEYEIANAGFENGDLCGWTATGEAFQDAYIYDISTFWTGGSYNKDGEYFFTANDHESELGTLSSRTFILGGSGWISFKIGAAKHSDELYISIMDSKGTIEIDDDVEISRYGSVFNDDDRTANMIQMKADISSHLGSELYVKIVDNATNDWAWISMDSFYMFYQNEADLPEAMLAVDLIAPDDTEPVISGFEDFILQTGMSAPDWLVGVSANDDADGVVAVAADASAVDLNTAGSYVLTYTATDVAGNIASITVDVVVTDDDITNPVMSGYELNVFVIVNTVEPNWLNGVLATDNVDGDITSSIELDKSDFDISVLGSYSFTLSVSDASANTDTVVINVTVVDTLPTVENDDFEIGDGTGWTFGGNYTAAGIVDEGEGYHYNSFPDGGEENTGTFTSSLFKLAGSGFFTFDIAGGKSIEEIYLSVYLEDGTEIGRYGNSLFGDNFNWTTYKIDLSAYMGEVMYIQMVDNATSNWAWIKLDNVITYYALEADLPAEAVAATELLVAPNTLENGDFETGDTTGWTFGGNYTAAGIVDEGEGYHYNSFSDGGEENTGTFISSLFTLDGSGFISYMIAGGANTEEIYLSVYLEDGTEVARYGNSLFGDNFDWTIYKIDLSEYIGEVMYIKMVDNATSGWAWIKVDDFVTYYALETDLPVEAVEAIELVVIPNTLENGNFETGDTTGWTFGGKYTASGIVDEGEGYHYNSFSDGGEENTGTFTSSLFKLDGSGFISYMIAGGANTEEIYLSVYLEDGTEVGRYGNLEFGDNFDWTIYKIDLSAHIGEVVYIQMVDNATSGWAWIKVDDFVSYYALEADLPDGSTLGIDLLTN